MSAAVVAIRDVSASPLTQPVTTYLSFKRKRLTPASERGYKAVLVRGSSLPSRLGRAARIAVRAWLLSRPAQAVQRAPLMTIDKRKCRVAFRRVDISDLLPEGRTVEIDLSDFSAESAQEAIDTAAALHGWDSLGVQFLHDFLMGATPDE